MVRVPDWPTLPLFFFLLVLIILRAGGTYAIGRGVRGLADRRSQLTRRPAVVRAEQMIERYGAGVVVLCFLTIGVQTAVNAAAGSLRMPLRRYLPALFLGGLIWATAYLTVGLAAIEAIWGGRGWLLPVVLVGLGTVGWLVHWWFERRARRSSRGPGASDPL